MKIKISSTDLNAMLKDATRAVETKGLVPWMTGVLLGAKGEEARAVCTNGTQTITRYAPCEVIEEGQILVDGKLLTNVASKMQPCTCVIDATNGKKAVIQAGGAKTNLALMNAEDFVVPAEIDRKFRIDTDAQQLFGSVKNVLYAVPAVEIRENLSGVNIQSKGNVLHFCGLDGFRMAISKVVTDWENEPINITIPRKTIADMMGIFPSLGNEITIVTDGKHIQIGNGAAYIQSQLLAGQYPNYKMIVQNHKAQSRAKFDVRQLKNAVERAMVVCEGKNNLIKVIVEENGLTVSSMGDAGDATELVECSVDGENMEIGFNGRLLLEALGAVNDDEAMLAFSSAVGPALLTAVDKGNWMHVVLPVRT